MAVLLVGSPAEGNWGFRATCDSSSSLSTNVASGSWKPTA